MGNVKRNKRTHLDRDTTGSCFYPQHSQNPSFLYFFSFLFFFSVLFSTQPLAQIALSQLGVGLVAPECRFPSRAIIINGGLSFSAGKYALSQINPLTRYYY